jgi:hypothetical protein
MMSFNEYWKEKAAKRRQSWASKSQRFAQKHTQLEAIRSEIVYGHMKREEVRSLRDEHRTVQNPIARWDSNMHFSFSEQGLREAMQAEGADVSSLTMTISKKNIVGQQPHEIAYGDMLNVASNRRDLYKKYTDLETCTINYREVTMVIYRYTYLQQPFGLYELVPCKQLSISYFRLEETSFSTLNIATFLMEMAAEWELRQEELNYHAKKLKLRTMEAATTDSIEFELWDDKKLQKKIQEYIGKDYQIVKILEQVLRPWKSAIKKYIYAATERTLNEQVQTFKHFDYWNKDMFWEKELVPYLNSVGLQDMETKASKDKMNIAIKSAGFQCYIIRSSDGIRLYPNSLYENGLIDLSPQTPLSAIGEYLKKMPVLSQRMEEEIIKAIQIYDQQMMQKPEYRHFVETVESLAVQNAGKPVGKLMKYLRWDAGRLYTTRFSPSTIKIKSDTAFSYEDKKCYKGVISNGVYTLVKDKYPERWVDAECRQVFIFDPVTTDVEAWLAANRHGIGDPKYEWKVGEFICSFMPIYSTPFMSFDFIDQKL